MLKLKKDILRLTQPTIRPLFDTRQFQEALLKWTGNDMSYHDYIKETWNGSVLGGGSFNQALHDGVFYSNGKSMTTDSQLNNNPSVVGGVNEDTSPNMGVNSEVNASETSSMGMERLPMEMLQEIWHLQNLEALELTLYTKIGMGDGQTSQQSLVARISRSYHKNILG